MITGGRVTAAYETVQGQECFTLKLEASINGAPSHIKVAMSAETSARGIEAVFDALWAAIKAENHKFN